MERSKVITPSMDFCMQTLLVLVMSCAVGMVLSGHVLNEKGWALLFAYAGGASIMAVVGLLVIADCRQLSYRNKGESQKSDGQQAP